jgi:biotin synthase
MKNADLRHDWTLPEIKAIYELPFNDLLLRAQLLHREHFPANYVQISTLMSVKTGACPEDCKYCSQSVRYDTGIEVEKLSPIEEVRLKAERAKACGASRFCMAGSYRSPKEKDFVQLIDMVKEVKNLGLETCLSAGMLNQEQVNRLEEAGLDYYNHNIDTSQKHYEKVATTRTYQDRLDTVERVRNSKINVCCGGILGLGEEVEDRFEFLMQLSNMPRHPESVPINLLVKIPGTPMGNNNEIEPIDFARTIATARMLMPKSYIRLSAGRYTMTDELQALCFFAGANSIHYGEKLLTTPLPDTSQDQALFKKLGITSDYHEHACVA